MMRADLRSGMRRGLTWLVILTLASTVLAAVPALGALGKKEPTPEQTEWWGKFSKEVKIENLEQDVRRLSSFSPRLAGYPGAGDAADYIVQRLEQLRLGDVSKGGIDDPKRPYREAYLVTVPWVEGQPTLEVLSDGEVIATYPIYPLWPDLVRTSQLPEGGREYRMIDGGDGRLATFNGKDIARTAVLMDFKCGSDWLNAPRLGAQAVVFVEPEATTRGEAEAKFLRIPINIPRFWIGRSDAYHLKARLKSQPEVWVRLNCRMSWEARKAWNIVAEIPGTDPELSKQTVYLTAYYDAMSIVPQLAPGAESASGAASLLEITRILAKYPPKRTVRVIFNGAHFLGLAGIRNYVATHLDELIKGEPAEEKAKFLGLIPYTKSVRKKMNINLFLAFDLSTQSERVGVFYKGMFYDQREDTDISRKFSDFGRTLRENAALMGDWDTTAGFGWDADAQFADAINPIYGKPWRTFIFGKIALDNEPITLGGGRGAAFVTTDDARQLVDTPFDTVEHVNFRNLYEQTAFLAASLWDIVTDPKMPVDKEPSFDRMSVSGGFAELSVRALAFDPIRSIVADKVIDGSMVIARMSDSTLMGTRGDLVEIVDKDGRVHFWGYPTINAYGWRKPTFIEAYHTNPDTGDIDFAPDWGPQGNRHYPRDPTQFFITAGKKEFTIVLFECVPIALFDLVDPQSLTTLKYIKVYDGVTDAEPRRYGLTVPHPEPWRGHVEDVALVFADRPPENPQRVKVMMGLGPGSVRMLLLDASTIDKKNPSGLGYLADKPFALSHTPLQVTRDMWQLDEMRLQKLASFRIVNEIISSKNPETPGLHEKAKALLTEAEAALADRDYQLADAKARAAWGYEARAYPAVLSTMNDVVKGVLFYLALMLPFAFFTERLIFAFPNLRTQIVGFIGIFAGICLVFSFIHPAFEITNNPWIVPLAFIMVALSVLVITLVTMKFESQLKALQMKVSGVHRADIGRMSVAAAAFSLGISNMRKRRARTVFTCLTLVLLTFTVLSFTSVKTATRYNERKAKGEPTYFGLLVRNAMWQPLEESAYRILNDEFGRDRAVAPRAWFFTSKTEEQSFIRVSTDATDATYEARAVTGLSPAEPDVTGIDEAMVAGRWFRPGDVHAAIIPTRMAEEFHIGRNDVGKVKIFLGGVPYDLIGIISASRAKRRVDLDQEPLTPVDWIQMQRMARQGGGQQASQQGQQSGFQEYLHLSPDQTVFVPFETALNLGAEVESVAVSFIRPEEVTKTLTALMPRLGFNLYAGTKNPKTREGEIRKWSAIGRTSIIGMRDVFIPILIAALIVLNTMLGAVYERVKEIHIFSSIGLAPSHIAMLFMAESFVYAILGAILGYLVGQGMAKVITVFDLLPGLYLNYSSVAAVASTTVVIGVVLLSTLYPARKASEVATPAIERSWQLPEPEGDRWEIPLPFAVTGEQATALTRFMMEWFEAYEEYSIGDFVTQDVTSREERTEFGTSYVIELMAWVAPFDLGVSQRVQLRTIPTDMEDVFEIRLQLERVSGDVSSWRRVNRRFLNTLRKQFLIWRTLRAEERDRYLGLTAAGEPAAGGAAAGGGGGGS